MLSKLKNTVKHTAIYSLGNIAPKFIGLILLPIYSKYLTIDQYGILSLLEVSNQFLIAFFTLGLPQAFLRWGADKQNIKDKEVISFNSYLVSLLIALTMYGLLFLFKSEISWIVFETEDLSFYFTYLLAWSALAIVNKIPVTLIRINEKSILYVILAVTKFTTILFLNIYFVAFKKFGVLGIVYGQLIGESIFFLFTLPYMIKNIKFEINPKYIKGMLKFGFPLILAAVSSYLLSFVDRYLLRYLMGLQEVGIYSLGYKFGSLINMLLVQSFTLGFVPIAYKMLDDPKSDRFFTKSFTYFIFISSICVLGLSIFSKEIVYFTTKDASYHQAYTVVPLIAFGFLIRGMFAMFTLPFQFVKKTSFKAYLVVFGAILTIVLNYILISVMGYYGAAVTMVVTYLTISVLGYLLSKSVYKINYEFGKIIKMISLIIILYSVSFLFNGLYTIYSIALKILLLISFPIILYFINFYEEIELLRLKQSWNKWKDPSKWRDNLRKIKL